MYLHAYICAYLYIIYLNTHIFTYICMYIQLAVQPSAWFSPSYRRSVSLAQMASFSFSICPLHFFVYAFQYYFTVTRMHQKTIMHCQPNLSCICLAAYSQLHPLLSCIHSPIYICTYTHTYIHIYAGVAYKLSA